MLFEFHVGLTGVSGLRITLVNALEGSNDNVKDQIYSRSGLSRQQCSHSRQQQQVGLR